MKRINKLITLIYVVVLGLLVSAHALAQTTISKIPFQGSLYDQGNPVNGTKTMVFTISAVGWTETQSVTVVNGLYSVVLGAVTPFPTTLFDGVDGQSMEITVDGTSMGSVNVYAPFQGIPPLTDSNVTKDITGLPDSVGFYSKLIGAQDPSNTSFFQVAVQGLANTNGNNVGVNGESWSSSGSWQIGIRGVANGDGTGPRYGLRAEVFGTNSGYSVAGIGYNLITPPDNATVTGLYGRTFNGGLNTYSMGLRGRAQGTGGINIGVKGEALNGDENWAGWFEGDVKITGNLSLDGANLSNSSLVNLNISDPAILGGQSFADISIANDPGGADPTGYSSQMFLQGNNTPNVQLGGQSWTNNNLPFMNLFGSTPDGGGWYQANLTMNVDTDGTFEAGNIGLHKSDIVGQTVETTINFDGMLGSISARAFDLNNGVNGFVNMGAKSWEGNNGNRRGFLHLQGTEDGLPNADSQRIFLEVNDDGSGSYGFLGLKNYQDDGGGNGAITVSLNGDNGSIYLARDAGYVNLNGQNGTVDASGDMSGNILRANEFSLNNGKVSVSSANNGNGDFGVMNLESPVGNSNRISMGFADVGENSGYISIWQDNGGGSDEYVLMNTVQGGPGGALFGSLFLKDDLGNTVSINGYGDIGASGTITAPTITQTSDRRFKKNIEPIYNALGNTLKLRGVSYQWKDNSKPQRKQIGVIAQELEAIYPEFVHTDEKGYKSVNYAQITAVLIEAVKELNAKVEALEGKNENLKAALTKVEALETQIKRFEELLSGAKPQAKDVTASR